MFGLGVIDFGFIFGHEWAKGNLGVGGLVSEGLLL